MSTPLATAPEWQVHLDLLSVDGWTDDQVAVVLDNLAQHGASLSGHPLAGAPGLVGVTLTVGRPDGPPIDLGQAISDATLTVLTAVGEAGAAVGRLVAAEALTAEEADRRLATPDSLDLVGVAEVADQLGVTRQRVSELARQPTSPSPVSQLASGPVWTRASWWAFLDRWNRHPGRPRRDQPAARAKAVKSVPAKAARPAVAKADPRTAAAKAVATKATHKQLTAAGATTHKHVTKSAAVTQRRTNKTPAVKALAKQATKKAAASPAKPATTQSASTKRS